MDYFEKVGGLGFGSRLKRLSDAFMNEVKLLYVEQGHDFEPKWFPLFSLLYHRGDVTVTSAAEELNLTHPHISQLAKEMAGAKLVSFKPNPGDARSRMLSLTEKGRRLAAQFEPLWREIRFEVQAILRETDPGFMESLEKMENLLREKSFSERVKARRRANSGEPRILEYSPHLRPWFEKLNREWIEKHFTLEPHDAKYFGDPERSILKKGGDILFAELDGEIVGTCALAIDRDQFELAKLAVTDKAKGRGVGELLSKEIIERARRKGARKISLTTNSQLKAAVRLYEKLGFKVTRRGPHPLYRRVDLEMEKEL